MSLVEREPKSVALADVASQARAYIAASRSENTLRAYRADWEHFTAWCKKRKRSSLPAEPETVALYVTEMANSPKPSKPRARASKRSVPREENPKLSEAPKRDTEPYSPSTIARRMVSIAQAHKAAGHRSPTTEEHVRLVNAGIRRTHGVAPKQVRPVVTEDLRLMVGDCGDDPAGIRDRALLLTGFAAALRRSEMVALDANDVEETSDGLVITVRRSKTDQEGAGRKIGVPYGSNPATCPVRAWRTWVATAGISEGPLFRGIDRHGNIAASRLSGRGVALIVKRRAKAAGIDPDTVSGHSLRAGLATSAAAAGVSERVIAATTGHKSMTVLRGYIRDGSLFTENAAAAVGL